jgi:hypothetical protein
MVFERIAIREFPIMNEKIFLLIFRYPNILKMQKKGLYLKPWRNLFMKLSVMY